MASTKIKAPKGLKPVSMEAKLATLERMFQNMSQRQGRSARSAERTDGSVPAAYGRMRHNSVVVRPHPKFKDAIIVEGQEYLGALKVPTAGSLLANQAGAVLQGGEIYISPGEFGNTRMAAYATLYEKFRFTELEFEYVPAVPTTTPGSMIVAYDRDIEDLTPPPTTDGIRMFCSFEGAQFGPVWKPFVSKCRLQAPDTGYYTSPGTDDRLCYQGQVYVAQMEPTGLAPSAAIGDLLVKYVLELFVPQLDPVAGSATVSGSASVAPLATDVLRQYLASNGGVANTNAENSFLPQLVNGLAGIKVNEGVYQLVNNLVNTVAATTALGAPVINMNTPPPASAPQPLVTNVTNVSAPAAVGAVAASIYQLAVPRGGAFITQAGTIGGAGGPNAANLFRFQRLSNAYRTTLL